MQARAHRQRTFILCPLLEDVIEAGILHQQQVYCSRELLMFVRVMHLVQHQGDAFIFLKGAPERVLEMCTRQRMIDGDKALDKNYWLTRIEEIAQQGQRVLAIAVKPISHNQKDLNYPSGRIYGF